MKGRTVIFLFALPFLGFGGFMGYSIGSSPWQAHEMRCWLPIEAGLVRAGYETHTGEDSDTYNAYAEYTYVIGDQTYRNDRVSIGGGAEHR